MTPNRQVVVPADFLAAVDELLSKWGESTKRCQFDDKIRAVANLRGQS